MTGAKPWYETLFERDWYDQLAPGGARSQEDPEAFEERTRREATFITNVLTLPASARVLDLCCGWGRHALVLAERGFAVTGLDRSAYHLSIARAEADRRGLDVRWVEADMREIPAADAAFDAVVNMFTAFGYFDDADNQRVLEEISRTLAPDGCCLIDVINRDYLMSVFTRADWQEAADGRLILERRRFDVQTGRVHAAWTLVHEDGTRSTHAHDERIYTMQELSLRCHLAGLEVDAAWGGYDESPLTRHSPRLIVRAHKR